PSCSRTLMWKLKLWSATLPRLLLAAGSTLVPRVGSGQAHRAPKRLACRAGAASLGRSAAAAVWHTEPCAPEGCRPPSAPRSLRRGGRHEVAEGRNGIDFVQQR